MNTRFNCFLTVDVIIRKDRRIVLIKRGHDPFKGKLALPGGFVEENETVEQAAAREAKEETGLKVKIIKILGVYSKPGRDPRGRAVSVVFVADVIGGMLKAGSDASGAGLYYPKKVLGKMSFDHDKVLQEYLDSNKFFELPIKSCQCVCGCVCCKPH